MNYYPELFSSDRKLPSYKTESDEEAIKYFKDKYKEDLQVIIKDDGQGKIECIWC